MGGYLSREWSEVVTGTSPGSPNDPPAERAAAIDSGEVARRRILRVDPRSISDDVTRTPIQVDRAPGSESSTPRAAAPPFLDPRSPSHDMPRTPIVKNVSEKALSLDDSIEIGAEPAEEAVPVPVRGASVVPGLKELEQKIENFKFKENENDENEKEDGEITCDGDDDNIIEQDVKKNEEITSAPKSEVKKEPLLLMPKSKFLNVQIQRVMRDANETKEDGEITHDSDDEEENKPLAKTPPTTIRSKSSLEADCRSPLLIENDEQPVFEKVLTSELAKMATKNTPKQRKPLGEVNNDSLVI